MEYVKSAAKSISRKLYAILIRCLRSLVWRVDEWVYAQEQKLKGPAIKAEYAAEVDPVASAAREWVHKKAARPRLPRLRYEQGSWVRQ